MSNANPFPGCVMFSRVRLSYPALTVPRAPKGSVAGVIPSYSADFIMASNDPKYAEFVNLCNQLAQAKWGQHYNNIIAAIYKDKDRRCFGQGDEKINTTTYAVSDGYAGQVWVKGSKKSDRGLPQMIGADNMGIVPTNADGTPTLAWMNEARKMYGGCYVNAVLKPWVYDNTFGKGFGADLIAIQFAADGDSFGESIRDASAMFAGATVAPQVPGAAPAWGAPVAPGMPSAGLPFPGAAPMPGAPFPGVQPPPFAMPVAAAAKTPWG